MTFIPTDLYDVKIYNHDKKLELVPRNLTHIEYYQRLSAPWNAQLTIETTMDDPYINTLRSIEDDWYIHIYRTDPITGIKSLVYEGFVITIVDQMRAAGNIIFNIYSSGYTQLLTRRIVLPHEGNEELNKSGHAETVLKSFVSECMVTPVDTFRICPGLALEPTYHRGDTVKISARYTNLMTVCQNVAEGGNIDFGIVGGTSLGDFILRAAPVWGKDKRIGNTDGNKPVVVSALTGTMRIPIYTHNTSDEYNYVYVGGSGKATKRRFRHIDNEAARLRSPFALKEAFVEGRREKSNEGLGALGWAYLNQHNIAETLSFDIIQREGTRWLVDWELGDLFTAVYFTHQKDKKIRQIGVVVTTTGSQPEVISVEMEDV